MLTNRKLAFVAALLIIAAFVLGVLQLLSLRFDTGDVYPPYSTLRADPLGARALYESLGMLPRFDSRRLYQPLSKIESGRDTALLILGTPVSELKTMSKNEFADFERLFNEGGRVVVSLYPQASKTWWERSKEKEAKERKAMKRGRRTPGERERMEWIDLPEKWGFKVELANLDLDDDRHPIAATAKREVEDSAFPATIAWHTAVYFDGLDKHWRTLYAREGKPVIIERPLGKGSLVLSSDSYIFSNEAMRNERHPGLLAWFVGSARIALFDETHLGVQEQPGIAALTRKYNLHGIVFGLLAVAGLFIWRNATSLAPPQSESQAIGNLVAGKDSAAGLVNLLRRNIAPADILAVAVAEWKKSGEARRMQSKLGEVEAIIQQEQSQPVRDSVGAYNKIASILSQRK